MAEEEQRPMTDEERREEFFRKLNAGEIIRPLSPEGQDRLQVALADKLEEIGFQDDEIQEDAFHITDPAYKRESE